MECGGLTPLWIQQPNSLSHAKTPSLPSLPSQRHGRRHGREEGGNHFSPQRATEGHRGGRTAGLTTNFTNSTNPMRIERRDDHERRACPPVEEKARKRCRLGLPTRCVSNWVKISPKSPPKCKNRVKKAENTTKLQQNCEKTVKMVKNESKTLSRELVLDEGDFGC